jgi:hypothetical protein
MIRIQALQTALVIRGTARKVKNHFSFSPKFLTVLLEIPQDFICPFTLPDNQSIIVIPASELNAYDVSPHAN